MAHSRKGKKMLEEQSNYVYRYWHAIEIKHKSSNLQSQHHSIWKEEYFRLENLQQKVYRELCSQFLRLTTDFPNCKHLNDFLAYGKKLELDTYKFETEVVYSNWELRDSIKRWLNLPENQRSNPELLEIQLLVASQENQITHDQLNNEFMCCDEEIKIMKNNMGLIQDEEDVSYHNDKIMPYFEELEFPDTQVKSALIEVLENINHKYIQRQKTIQKEFQRYKNPGLGDYATPIIKHVINCYPTSLINRKVLYMDCLRRIFPTKSLNELVIQERWIEACRIYAEQNKQCMEDWTRELWTWLLHSAATCSKEQQLFLKEKKNKNEVEKQKAVCEDLKKKVERLREERRVKVKFLDEMDKRKLVKSQMKELEKTKKELERRQMEKLALRHYYETTLRKKKEEEMAALTELQNIKRQNKERERKNIKRMQFRSKVINEHSKTVTEKLMEIESHEEI